MANQDPNVLSSDQEALAIRIAGKIDALPEKSTQSVRAVRKHFTGQLKDASPDQMLELAHAMIRRAESLRWVAYEFLHYHKPALNSLGEAELEALGSGMDSWDKVDTFASWLAGVAWRQGQITDRVVHRWAASEDRWWRRAALVSTVALNTRARGGRGDVPRTLAVCRLLVDDRDDMVVKALSWALRELVPYDRQEVYNFLSEYDSRLAARVRREVRSKLETGLKNPPGE